MQLLDYDDTTTRKTDGRRKTMSGISRLLGEVTNALNMLAPEKADSPPATNQALLPSVNAGGLEHMIAALASISAKLRH